MAGLVSIPIWLLTLCLLLYCATTAAGAKNNAGQKFVLGFMSNPPYSSSRAAELYISTLSETPIDVTVSTPKAGGSSQTVSVVKHKKQIVTIDKRMEANKDNNNGILVETTDGADFFVVGLNKQLYYMDSYLAIPYDALGNEYYSICFKHSSGKCEIGMVSSVEGTKVTLTIPVPDQGQKFTYDGKTYDSSKPTVEINIRGPYTTLEIRGGDNVDLSGIHITANKPTVAVFSGSENVNLGSPDMSPSHLEEMLPPVTTWGKKFIVAPSVATTVKYKLKIVAKEATSVWLHGGTGSEEHTLSGGHHKELTFNTGAYIYIESNVTILVAQLVMSYSGDAGDFDPSMVIIPPLEQYTNQFVLSTLTPINSEQFDNNFVLIIKQEDKDGLLLNCSYLNVSSQGWNQVPNTSYVVRNIHIESDVYIVSHSSPTATFMVMQYGVGSKESQGNPGGMGLESLYGSCVNSAVTKGDGKDNDCDGRVDEEFDNGLDDDGDGKVDEDTVDLDKYSTCPDITFIVPTAAIEYKTTTYEPEASTSETLSSTSETLSSTSELRTSTPELQVTTSEPQGSTITYPQGNTSSELQNNTSESLMTSTAYPNATVTFPEEQETSNTSVNMSDTSSDPGVTHEMTTTEEVQTSFDTSLAEDKIPTTDPLTTERVANAETTTVKPRSKWYNHVPLEGELVQSNIALKIAVPLLVGIPLLIVLVSGLRAMGGRCRQGKVADDGGKKAEITDIKKEPKKPAAPPTTARDIVPTVYVA